MNPADSSPARRGGGHDGDVLRELVPAGKPGVPAGSQPATV